MQNPNDKVEQLKKSMKAQEQADQRKQESEKRGIAPGVEDQYKEKVQSLEKELETAIGECETLKKQAAQAHDNFLRKHAELENFRKRMEREKTEIVKYGSEKIMKELLPVLDSLEKAIEHAEDSSNLETLAEGVELVLKQFLQALEKHGTTPIQSLGESFDPNIHEAVAHEESEHYPPNAVTQEHRRGYKMHDRLLRPAMVSVAKASEQKDS